MSTVYGTLANGSVTLTDGTTGYPVTFTDAPQTESGYKAVFSWSLSGGSIVQVWSVEPLAGSVSDAMIALAQKQAEALSDDDALDVAALYPVWHDLTGYTTGQRFTYDGVLYKVLQDHQSQTDWTPGSAPSLYSKVLPGQSGEVGEWAQPDSTNGYSTGDKVAHNGKTWVSLVNNNVWEPGATGTETVWEEVTTS